MKQHFALWQKDLKKKKEDIMKSSQLNLSNGGIECTRYVPDIKHADFNACNNLLSSALLGEKKTDTRSCPLNSRPQRGKNSHP